MERVFRQLLAWLHDVSDGLMRVALSKAALDRFSDRLMAQPPPCPALDWNMKQHEHHHEHDTHLPIPLTDLRLVAFSVLLDAEK
jgi:hypothetical protein